MICARSPAASAFAAADILDLRKASRAARAAFASLSLFASPFVDCVSPFASVSATFEDCVSPFAENLSVPFEASPPALPIKPTEGGAFKITSSAVFAAFPFFCDPGVSFALYANCFNASNGATIATACVTPSSRCGHPVNQSMRWTLVLSAKTKASTSSGALPVFSVRPDTSETESSSSSESAAKTSSSRVAYSSSPDWFSLLVSVLVTSTSFSLSSPPSEPPDF
mmetsp:Transcript_6955/g.26274  ORF Transcript_6955/g.26274 Transcript_6955/m.26274 type:complete len:225 (+) Transcript_6955:181-855(+)